MDVAGGTISFPAAHHESDCGLSYARKLCADERALTLTTKFDKVSSSRASRRIPTTRRHIEPTPPRISGNFHFTSRYIYIPRDLR